MSILIRGMKMPKNCIDCPLFESLYHFHGCHANPESFNDMDMWNFFVGDRPSWCPLVEVSTPHGRLIDADAFGHIIGQFSLTWEYGQGVSDCLDALLAAPTIIPAEEKE